MPNFTKIGLAARTEAEAHRAADLLGEVAAVSPDAVTVFEAPVTGGWVASGYYADLSPADAAAICTAMRVAAPHLSPRVEDVPDEDWAAKVQRDLHPVSAGRFFVHGSHDREVARGKGRWAIEIDAGEAFGTAHHATTTGCLAAIDRLAVARSFTSIADIGCGSGILAIAAARVWPKARIVASDLDPIATAVARENVRLNAARVRIVTAAGFEHPVLRHPRSFDLVLANILAEPLQALAPTIRTALRPGGVAVLSGLLTPQVPRVVASYGIVGIRKVWHRDINGWSALILRRA